MKKLLPALVFLGALCLTAAVSRAADYPDHPIRLVVGYGPGVGADFTARLVGAILSERLGQPIVVENKPGAGSTIAVDYVAKSAPDGYTLLWGTADGVSIMPAVKTVPFKVPDGLTYISRVVEIPLAIAVSAKLPVTSIAELIAYAKANPNKLRYGTTGVGSGPHLAMLMLEKQAGIQMTHVPYKGSVASLTDLLAGFIDVAIGGAPAFSSYMKSDKIRVIAVTAAKRIAAMPDVPTWAEGGLSVGSVASWGGLLGPAGLPRPIVSRIEAIVSDALKDPDVMKKLAAAGWDLAFLGARDFEKSGAEELKSWKAIATEEHIHIED